MAEVVQPKFEHAALEKDIQRLSMEIRDGRAEHDQTRDVLKAALQERFLPKTNEVQIDGKGKESTAPSILPSYLQKAPDDVKLKVERLLDLAWHKGIAAGTKEAAKEGPLFLDAFHDALTDKLYEEFKRRGIIQ